MASRRNGYQPHITIELIGPAEATDLLLTNSRNRHVRQRRVEQYARDMSAGNWHPVGEPIVVSNKGKLINGQHRLLAVVEADVRVGLPVLRGVPPEVQDVMDRGLSRSFKDVLKLHYDTTNTATLAAAVRQVHQYRAIAQMGNTGGHMPATSPTTSELIATHEAEPNLIDSLSASQKARREGIWFAPGLLMALHYVFSEIDSSEAEGFYERLVSGASLERGNPILALRKLGMRRPMDLSSKAQAAVMIKAFNFWRAGRHVGIGSLRWRAGGSAPEAFPRVLTKKEIAAGASEAVVEEIDLELVSA